MIGRSDQLASSSERPLALRMRTDLIYEQHRYLGRLYWVIKDPISLKYYRFEEEEFSLLRMLDGTASLAQLKRRFEERYAPQTITHAELHRFLGSLNRSALVVSTASGQGTQLLDRSRKLHRKRVFASMSNVLAMRVRGFDPDRLLAWMDRRVGWFFSLPMLLLMLATMAIAGLLLAVQFDVFQSRLPEFQSFFAIKNWFWLAMTLACTKVLHEFGHGLACKRFGGECHEMGLMLLVFTPCLYCNVSDSWMLRSKWKRAAIAAAGIYVELLLASIATLVWWFTLPGFLNSICLNVMFVCSVSTLLFNANPLLKYDGYYILSDLLEMPNLRQKANATIRRKLGSIALGLPEVVDPFMPAKHRGWFATYAVASAVYRWFVVFAIFWMVYQMLEPYGLKIVGQMLAFMAAYALFVLPVIQLIRFFHVPGRVQKVKPLRLAATFSVAAVVVVGILFIPIPYWIDCPVYVQPRGAQTIYVSMGGTVDLIHRRPGDEVEVGMPVLSLANRSIDIEIIELESALRVDRARVTQAVQSALYAPDEISRANQFEQAAQSTEEQLSRRIEERNMLTIAAPRSGTLFPAPYVAAQARTDSDQLDSWSGTPLDRSNVGATLPAGTVVGVVGDRNELEVVLAVDQEDIDLIATKARVKIQFEQLRSNVIESRVELVSPTTMRAVPRGLSLEFGGPIATSRSGQDGQHVNQVGHSALRPHQPTYQVLCALPQQSDWVGNGAIGRAKVHAGNRTVGWRLWQWSMRTFNFEL